MAQMIPLEDYVARVLEAIVPLASTRVALGEAHGRILAEDVSAAVPVPPWTNSAMDGYAVRVRVTFPGRDVGLAPFDEATDHLGAYERRILAALLSESEADATASIAVKSPAVAAERYEMETEVDVSVATQILRRSPNVILKNRYSMWYDEDGWEFDIFGGQNEGLVIAECERLAPVVGLRIPRFCTTEVSDDFRFTNDYLSKEPWRQWKDMYAVELEARGPHFLDMR